MKIQFISVTQLCPTLCDPMDCSTPGFPVHHQLLELANMKLIWKLVHLNSWNYKFLPLQADTNLLFQQINLWVIPPCCNSSIWNDTQAFSHIIYSFLHSIFFQLHGLMYVLKTLKGWNYTQNIYQMLLEIYTLIKMDKGQSSGAVL